ncbi:MAG: hypothetical protein AAF211_17975, partial [Myxococcota bacterium]
ILFATTKAVQDHSLRLDFLRVGNLPLRINSRLTFRAYRSDNFCGFGNDVTCSVDEAEQRLDELGVTGEEREDQLDTYYKTRYVNPNIDAIARWEVDPMPHRVELFAGVRALTLRPGDFRVDTTYPDSAFAQVRPDGDRGFLGVVNAGVMLDNRDNEPAPIRGVWLEASARGASSIWGSASSASTPPRGPTCHSARSASSGPTARCSTCSSPRSCRSSSSPSSA